MNFVNSIKESFQMKYKFWEILEIGKSKKMILMKKSLIIRSKLESREIQTFKKKLNLRNQSIKLIHSQKLKRLIY